MSDNLARGKLTGQSSTYYRRGVGYFSKLAVDGNLYTRCACTKYQYGPWWGVDLGSQKSVSEVYIVTSGYCYGERLSSFEIRVGMF